MALRVLLNISKRSLDGIVGGCRPQGWWFKCCLDQMNIFYKYVSCCLKVHWSEVVWLSIGTQITMLRMGFEEVELIVWRTQLELRLWNKFWGLLVQFQHRKWVTTSPLTKFKILHNSFETNYQIITVYK